MPPKLITTYDFRKNIGKCRAQVTQLVRSRQIDIESQSLRCPLFYLIKAYIDEFDVGRTTLRRPEIRKKRTSILGLCLQDSRYNEKKGGPFTIKKYD